VGAGAQQQRCRQACKFKNGGNLGHGNRSPKKTKNPLSGPIYPAPEGETNNQAKRAKKMVKPAMHEAANTLAFAHAPWVLGKEILCCTFAAL
jgi:hypothetical protein